MIGIVDYGAGNIKSVSNALDRLRVPYFVSQSIKQLERAEKLILPGVGEARSAMESLGRVGLIQWLKTIEIPFLGICIGMQLLFEHSAERDTQCLGILPGAVQRFDATKVKVPHMGWNQVCINGESLLFHDINNNEFFYFVHSFYAPVTDRTVGLSEHGDSFSAAVQKGKYFGVQFHAEKSGSAGLQLLRNFVELC